MLMAAGMALFLAFSEYSLASGIKAMYNQIPEEDRVYTEAVITRIVPDDEDSYDVYGILDDDEEKLERKFNFYSNELKEDTKVPVYHEKGSYSYISSKIVEPNFALNYEKSLKKLKIFGTIFVILSLIMTGAEIYEKVYIKKGN